ncbi:type VII secretion system-associated protein [Kitasatospora sp. NPDC048365]|uniref:type VII secretion system-associated protein n=1 Tax=Kitasatospora sp. NPDC048365 TaxID=3364050 RepID=UPI003712E1C5
MVGNVDGWLPPLRAGRQPAGRALLAWLDDAAAPRLCRVTGGPGSGKTHLVRWLATACSSPGGRRVDVAESAAGLGPDDVSRLLARRLGLPARTPDGLVAALGADPRPRRMLVWDVDRAAEPAAVAVFLTRLAGLPHVRAVLDLGKHGTPEAVAAFPGAAVLDLDDPRWTDPARFAAWYGKLGGGAPFSTEDVFPAPGPALLAARVPADADPSAGYATAWWAALPAELRPAVRALAAADRPLTRTEWAALAGPEAVGRVTEWLPATSEAEDTWSLGIGPLRDTVLAGAPAPDHDAAVRALAAAVPRVADGPDLPAADPGVLGLLLHHAVAAAKPEALLEDPRFLAYADPVAVTAGFAAHPHSRYAAAWRSAAPALIGTSNAWARAAVLRSRLLATDPAAAAALDRPGPWRAEWAAWCAVGEPELLAGSLTRGAYSGYAVLADAEGGLRAVQLATGQLSDVPANPVPAGLRALAALEDGGVVALDGDGHAGLLAGSALPALPAAPDRATPTALGPLLALGDSAGAVHWRAADGGTATQRLHEGPVAAVGGTVLASTGRVLLVSGGRDGCVRLWRPGSAPMAAPVDRRDCPVTAVAVAHAPQGVVIAAAWADGLIRVRSLDAAEGAVDVRLGSPVRSVLIDASGRLVAVLADGVLCLSVDPQAPNSRDLSTTGGYYFSPEPPPAGLPAVPGAAEPALPEAVVGEARHRPGQWLFLVDTAFDAAGSVPSEGIVGCWQIDHHGAPARYIANPAHRSARAAADLPEPQSEAEAVLQQLATGIRGPQDLLATLLGAELHVCTVDASGALFTSLGVRGGHAVDACTSEGLVPRHWAGTAVLTGRELAAAAAGCDLRLNPGSKLTVTFPVDDLARNASAVPSGQ